MNTETTNSTTTLAEVAQDVQAHSAELKKELSLFDLVLTQILFVVGTFWVGWGARLGYEQNVFWILAIITFYVPLALAVIFLNRLMPLEGGLYQWTKAAFNDFVAFMVGWNLWVFAIIILAGVGLLVTRNISYMRPSMTWMKDSNPLILLISVVLIAGMIIAATRGLAVGKWVHKIGAVAYLLTFGALICLPLVVSYRAPGAFYQPLTFPFPTFSSYHVNIYSKLALGALTGFEYIAILAGETHSARRNIGRSVVISAPIIAAMFILGTSSVIAFVTLEKTEVVAPIAQALSTGFGPGGLAGVIGSIMILGIALRTIGLTSLYFAGNTRLPMVAGWDRLLPAWFSRLHPQYKTPFYSIVFVGAVTLAICFASLSSAKAQEAFQLIDNAGGVFYALTYLVLFAIPLFGMKRLGHKSPWWLKLACASGFIVTLLFIGYSPVPIVHVDNPTKFAVVIVASVLIGNAIGIGLYVVRTRK